MENQRSQQVLSRTTKHQKKRRMLFVLRSFENDASRVTYQTFQTFVMHTKEFSCPYIVVAGRR